MGTWVLTSTRRGGGVIRARQPTHRGAARGKTGVARLGVVAAFETLPGWGRESRSAKLTWDWSRAGLQAGSAEAGEEHGPCSSVQGPPRAELPWSPQGWHALSRQEGASGAQRRGGRHNEDLTHCQRHLANPGTNK